MRRNGYETFVATLPASRFDGSRACTLDDAARWSERPAGARERQWRAPVDAAGCTPSIRRPGTRRSGWLDGSEDALADIATARRDVTDLPQEIQECRIRAGRLRREAEPARSKGPCMQLEPRDEIVRGFFQRAAMTVCPATELEPDAEPGHVRAQQRLRRHHGVAYHDAKRTALIQMGYPVAGSTRAPNDGRMERRFLSAPTAVPWRRDRAPRARSGGPNHLRHHRGRSRPTGPCPRRRLSVASGRP
jgi:hypothetical protein